VTSQATDDVTHDVTAEVTGEVTDDVTDQVTDDVTNRETERLPPDRDLAVLLGKALRLLGDAGRPVAASRLAGQAWWALRAVDDERGAARINGLMHYLAKLPPEPEEATALRPSG
jgi:hypothetical protein